MGHFFLSMMDLIPCAVCHLPSPIPAPSNRSACLSKPLRRRVQEARQVVFLLPQQGKRICLSRTPRLGDGRPWQTLPPGGWWANLSLPPYGFRVLQTGKDLSMWGIKRQAGHCAILQSLGRNFDADSGFTCESCSARHHCGLCQMRQAAQMQCLQRLP